MKPQVNDLIKRLKPVAHVFKFTDETPHRVDSFLDVGAEITTSGKCIILTFWFRWDHDWESDGKEDWEPVTYIVKDNKVIDIQTRPHWKLVRWITDQPVLQDGERAIIYFSKNGHAPYLSVQSNAKAGWLKNTLDKITLGRETGLTAPDFLKVMDERDLYVNIPSYDVKKDHKPPTESMALTGMQILGRRFFDDWFKKPETC